MRPLSRYTRLRADGVVGHLDKPGHRRFELCRIASYNATRYSWSMIKSFQGKETEKIWRGQRSRQLPQDIQQAARRKLRMINNACTVDDLRVPPANRLERLRGDRAGQYSIRINDQWRICFVWKRGDAFGVEIVDYH